MDYNVVIINSNENESMDLRMRLDEEANIRVVGVFSEIDSCINFLQKNAVDLVITDIILKNSDGFQLLEQIKRQILKKPKILILSAVTGDSFVQKALSLGANYYMMKPYNYNLLYLRIQELLNRFTGKKVPISNIAEDGNKTLDGRLSNIFITVGIPAHIKGYTFLREAVKMAIQSPECINSITKKLYPTIAEKFDTSTSKVERAIRHAIEVAWNKGKIENINNVFGVQIYTDNEKPTNGEFIALVADKMLIEGA